MPLAFDARQHLFDVVETSDEAGSEIKSLRSERPPWPRRSLEGRQPRAERFIDDCLKRQFALARYLLKSSRHVVLEGHRGAHIMML